MNGIGKGWSGEKGDGRKGRKRGNLNPAWIWKLILHI